MVFNKFNSSKFVSGTRDFLQSNSLAAKFAFLLLVIILFVLLLKFGVILIAWLVSPSKSPILIDCMHSGKSSKIISTDPNNGPKAIPIMRSKNDKDGMDFTWSTWLYVEDSTFDSLQRLNQEIEQKYSISLPPLKHVFSKGEYKTISIGNSSQGSGNLHAGMLVPNNSPGVYIGETTREFESDTPNHIVSLYVVVNVFETSAGEIAEIVEIPGLPLNKWVNVVIRLTKQKQLDVYINGSLTKRHILGGVVKQNYGSVQVCQNGGFDGWISSLRYYDYGLGTNQIMSISQAGPTVSLCNKSATMAAPPYLSTSWYFAGANDAYNP